MLEGQKSTACITLLGGLDLADSSCKVLEEGIGELFPMIDSGQLTFVDFDNNTFESPPPIVQRRGGTEVVRYMHQFNNLKVVDPRMLAEWQSQPNAHRAVVFGGLVPYSGTFTKCQWFNVNCSISTLGCLMDLA